MRRLYLINLFALIFISTFSLQTKAQTQIVNLGFENWDGLGTTSEEPVGWNSFMNAENNGVAGIVFNFARSQKVERSTDKRPGSAGNYSARIWSNSVVGNVANGNLTTGRIMVGSTTPSNSANHNKTKTAEAAYNQPFTGLPDSLVVWVKYTASAGNEARISATIHGNYDYRDPEASDPNAASFVVGRATLNYPPTGGVWQRISIPFDYNYPHNDPRYILITFTTNKTPGGGSSGDAVFIDDLEFIYVPKVTIAPTTAQNLIVTQNGAAINASENFTATSREWKFSTVSGSGYTSFTTAQTGLSYTPNFSSAGTYYVVCESNNNGTIVRSNEVVINVSEFTVNVTPANSQTLFQNETGLELAVSEQPQADSRVWKFSTTSGGPYLSFTPSISSTTFTPLFSSVGTYFVVSESTKNGVTKVSNEVEIVVNAAIIPTISITPSLAQFIEVNQNGITLSANETVASSAREWKFATNIAGPFLSFSTAETGVNYTPLFTQEGVYYIRCESEMNDTIRTSNVVTIEVADLEITIEPSSNQSIFENISGDSLFVLENRAPNSREWKFATISGGPYQSFATTQTENVYVPLFENLGEYFIICESTFSGIVKQSNEVFIEVNEGPQVTITPIDSQEIFTAQNGNTLTVEANGFIIDTQEWKFANSINSFFQSFTPPEFETTYTPRFIFAGEYFVRCETEILGQEFVSNIVRILVSEQTTTISILEKPNFKVYSNNKDVVVDLSETSIQNGIIKIVNAKGQIVLEQTLQEFSVNKISTKSVEGIHFYIIESSNKFYHGKLYIK